MRIRKRKLDSTRERLVLTGMIVSTDFIRRIRHIWSLENLTSDYAKTVAEWCLAHYDQYNRAPDRDIEHIYYERGDRLDDKSRESIEKLLSRLDDEYGRQDKLNVEYLLDQAQELFRKNRLRHIHRELGIALDDGDGGRAEQALLKYKGVEADTKDWINPYTDIDAIQAAFRGIEEPLMRLPGAIGTMLNTQLMRGGFLAFMGPDKVGKTWWLDLIAHNAGKCRCNVVFFSVGDMDESELILRKGSRMTWKASHPALLGETVRIPREVIEISGDGNFSQYGYEILYDEKTVDALITESDVIKAGQRYARRMKGRDYRLYCYPNDTVSVDTIKTKLDIMEETDNFIPDVIVIDYADILIPGTSSPKEFRHQENQKWKALRGLAQERHCLVVTATQSDAAAYTKSLLGKANFSEDKRKVAHVTGLIGLNQNEEEKEAGCMRLNQIVRRQGRFHSRTVCTVFQCLELGQCLVDSRFLEEKKSENDAESEKNH